MSFLKSIYEHLKTRKKYNTLKIKYEVLQEDYDKKVVEYEQLKNQYKTIKDVWTKKLEEQEEKIIELKKKGVKKNVSKSNNVGLGVSKEEQNNK